MADGTSKPISQVRVGDKVDNAPPGALPGSKDVTHRVTAVHVTHDDKAYTAVTVSTTRGQATITGTAYHLYWDATTGKWTQARQLRVGDHLQSTEGGQTVITAMHSYTTTMVTYNLTIDTLHTYYVVAVDATVLVHNCPARFGNGGKRPPKAPTQRNTDAGSFGTRIQAWEAATNDAKNYRYATPREECSSTACHVPLDIYNNKGELLETRHYSYPGKVA